MRLIGAVIVLLLVAGSIEGFVSTGAFPVPVRLGVSSFRTSAADSRPNVMQRIADLRIPVMLWAGSLAADISAVLIDRPGSQRS